MSKTPKHHAYCFLNALALKYRRHPAAIDPLTVLPDLFDFSPPQEQALFLEKFCTAALTNTYAWKEGSPAQALDYGRELEMLVEVAWLLYKKGNNSTKKQCHTLPGVKELPMPLTAAEYRQPQLYLQQFFADAPLRKWKLLIAAFTVNAISNESVADELPGKDLPAFAISVNKLIYTIYRVAVLKGVELQ
ncbi:hypothetical protein A8C56_17165 [Niabella ginsenosidivorans]|uniref:Uncharacterized protein n=1 Tax=Niabella ginsenosidivorans TaxID=1176587 RepID=A0A1A9I470_9BACT|nr:hypothetical protein [Niabella ginsenosidivorans]ANH82468.1 hypothetical protein A8C56_17165 [Niabella ginsenosidivorans]